MESKGSHIPKIFKGTVHIMIDRCKGCEFCVEYCPKKILGMSVDFNLKGYHYPEILDEKGCVNCKVCEDICPDFAIYSIGDPPEGKFSSDRRVQSENRRKESV